MIFISHDKEPGDHKQMLSSGSPAVTFPRQPETYIE